eukprot:SAG22_NODE_376_length_11537_cov_29.420353_2_plen_156_part_00
MSAWLTAWPLAAPVSSRAFCDRPSWRTDWCAVQGGAVIVSRSSVCKRIHRARNADARRHCSSAGAPGLSIEYRRPPGFPGGSARRFPPVCGVRNGRLPPAAAAVGHISPWPLRGAQPEASGQCHRAGDLKTILFEDSEIPQRSSFAASSSPTGSS